MGVITLTKEASTVVTANPQMVLKLTKDFVKRNNPVEGILLGLLQTIYGLVTLRSRMRLLKYNYHLAQQKLNRMQDTLGDRSPYDVRGAKMNRIY